MADTHEAVFTWPYLGPNNVVITGTFDNWSRSISLEKTGDGFVKRVPLKWGEKVQYKYIVDGRWSLRADRPTEGDGNGNTNHVYTAPPKTIITPPPPLDPLPETTNTLEPPKTSLEQTRGTGVPSEGNGSTTVTDPPKKPLDASIPEAPIVDAVKPPSLPEVIVPGPSVIVTASDSLESTTSSEVPISPTITQPSTTVTTPEIGAPIAFEETKKDIPQVLKGAEDQVCPVVSSSQELKEPAPVPLVAKKEVVPSPQVTEKAKVEESKGTTPPPPLTLEGKGPVKTSTEVPSVAPASPTRPSASGPFGNLQRRESSATSSTQTSPAKKSFLSRNSSESSPSKGSLKGLKSEDGRKRKTSLYGRIKHLFTDHGHHHENHEKK